LVAGEHKNKVEATYRAKADKIEDKANLQSWASKIKDVKEDSAKKQKGFDGWEDRHTQARWTKALKDGIEDSKGGKGADKFEDKKMTTTWNDFIEDTDGKLLKQANNASKGGHAAHGKHHKHAGKHGKGHGKHANKA
jgi:hypothetical protein